MKALESRIKQEIENVLSIAVIVKLVVRKFLDHSVGKVKRLIDERKM